MNLEKELKKFKETSTRELTLIGREMEIGWGKYSTTMTFGDYARSHRLYDRGCYLREQHLSLGFYVSFPPYYNFLKL